MLASNQNRNMLPHTYGKKLFLVKINLHQRIINENNFSKYRLTVDYIEDLNLISELIKKLGVDLSWKDM